jgi:hypothetical protein
MYDKTSEKKDVQAAVEYLQTEFADMYPEATFLGRRSIFISAADESERDTQQKDRSYYHCIVERWVH